mgnify:CR=1 FL=1
MHTVPADVHRLSTRHKTQRFTEYVICLVQLFVLTKQALDRLLRCFVVIELKTHKITHEDIGQLQMYVNYYDRNEKAPDENPTIGILLCADKNDTLVKYTLPENNNTILASKYQLYLPSEKQLAEQLKIELQELNQ